MNRFCEIATLLTVSCVFCGCDGVTRISGVVTDYDTKPISGAKVSVVPSGKFRPPPTKTTDANGAFDIDFTHARVASTFKLIVTHADYQTVEETMKTGPHPNHDIRMATNTDIEKGLGYGAPQATAPPSK